MRRVGIDGRMFYRLDLGAQSWIQDDEQGGKQLPSG